MIGICNDLRKAVLQAAIQGKLTEQLKTDGSAEALYAEIQKEKQKLIAEKKIKKEKPLEPIDFDEVPFDIPDNWKWVQLYELLSEQPTNGFSPKSIVKETNFKKIALSATTTGIFREIWNYVDITKEQAQKNYIKRNDLLIQRSNSREYVGTACIYEGEDDVYIFPDLIMRMRVMDMISLRYIYYSLRSPYLKKYFSEKASGTSESMPKINQNIVKKALLPLPPLDEQQRIVAKVDELMSKIDEMEKTEKSLINLYDTFPGDMKASILQAAIQGKLTEQLASDGDAETLYAEIQAEKKRLIKEGKIKKEKELEPIDLDEVPFDIPDNWKWVRLGEIFAHNTGKALNQRNEEGSLMSYITTSNLYWNGFVLDNLRSMKFTESEIDKCTVKKGDLLVCEGGDIGRSAIWPYEYEMRIQNHIHKLRAYKKVCTKFYWYVLLLYKLAELIGGKGIGIQGLSSNALHMLQIPLPPLAEQKRIVEKLDQFLPLCDSMKEAIDIKL